MQFLDAQSVKRLTPYPNLVATLESVFRDISNHPNVPPREHYFIPDPKGAEERTLLVMPVWDRAGMVMIKLVNVVPANSEKSIPAIQAQLIVSDEITGEWILMMDGAELTARRTAAASVLAARYLANAEAKSLLMVGTGRLATELINAYRALFPSIEQIFIWGRDNEKAKQLADTFENVLATDELENSCGKVEIISCATLSRQALIKGDWVRPGTHIDLVGAFRKDMRECDTKLVKQAKIYVDTRAGAIESAGDLHFAKDAGVFKFTDIKQDLYELCASKSNLFDSNEITLFKSVGTAIEDYAATKLIQAGITSK